MQYRENDINLIAEFLIGNKNDDLPKFIKLDETNLYDCCDCLKLDTSFIYDNEYNEEILSKFLIQLIIENQFIAFLNYYLYDFIDSKVVELTESGYGIFTIKDKILKKINTLWSIELEEFLIDKNTLTLNNNIRFKEFNKLGEGGFSFVYKDSVNDSIVYKVLSAREKSEPSSVHRFKREFQIMEEENESNFTIKVNDFEKDNSVYCMEKADISLEDYILNNILDEDEKDKIIIRCAKCMEYLHSKNILHRDFHPGNILKTNDNLWKVTDFGLSKNINEKYSHITTTTHAVGRSLFTDPTQVFALINSSIKTDIYSLAKTIDFIMNKNFSGLPHKFSSVIYIATAPDLNSRYNSVDEIIKDLLEIINRKSYLSPFEQANKIINEINFEKNVNMPKLIRLLETDNEKMLLFQLIINTNKKTTAIFLQLININFNLALKSITNVYDALLEEYVSWDNYDSIANFANDIVLTRKINDEINIQSAKIIEYIASSGNSFNVKKLSNTLKHNDEINGHVREILSYYDGY